MDRDGMFPQSTLNSNFGPQSTSSDPDDHSFIVLDRVTAEDSEKIDSELSSSMMRSFNFGSVAFSNHFGAVPPVPVALNGELPSQGLNESFSLPSDVQQRMDSLMHENVKLQVTVDQTNVALRQIMLTFTQWRKDMEKVREDHKVKFQETRSLVMKLKKEKAEMRAEIEELKSRPMQSLFEHVSADNDIIKNLSAQLNTTKEAYQTEIDKTNAYSNEVSDLKEECNTLRMELDRLQSLRQDFDQQLSDLEVLREENSSLKNDIRNLTSVERHSQDYQVAQAKGFNLRVDELTAKLILSEEELGKARTEIEFLKRVAGGEFESGSSSNNAESTVARLRLRIDEMTASIVELEQKSDTQKKEIHDLKDENFKINALKDEAISILQAQVEVYRSDFNTERNCREQLAGEKEQLAEDLRKVHRRCLELQEMNRNADQVRLPEEAPQQPTSIFSCPICARAFRTLQSLNEHIDSCLTSNTELG